MCRTFELLREGYDFSQHGYTWQQYLTSELIAPRDSTSCSMDARDDGTCRVEYRSDFGPYSEVIARYVILPGASYMTEVQWLATQNQH